MGLLLSAADLPFVHHFKSEPPGSAKNTLGDDMGEDVPPKCCVSEAYDPFFMNQSEKQVSAWVLSLLLLDMSDSDIQRKPNQDLEALAGIAKIEERTPARPNENNLQTS